jgi:hypothetical protein
MTQNVLIYIPFDKDEQRYTWLMDIVTKLCRSPTIDPGGGNFETETLIQFSDCAFMDASLENMYSNDIRFDKLRASLRKNDSRLNRQVSNRRRDLELVYVFIQLYKHVSRIRKMYILRTTRPADDIKKRIGPGLKLAPANPIVHGPIDGDFSEQTIDMILERFEELSVINTVHDS